jgi:hypothetical protein
MQASALCRSGFKPGALRSALVLFLGWPWANIAQDSDPRCIAKSACFEGCGHVSSWYLAQSKKAVVPAWSRASRLS